MVDMARAKPRKSIPCNDLQHIPHIPHGINGIYGTSHTPFMHKSCIKGLKYKNTSYIYIWVSERGAINTTETTWDMWCGLKRCGVTTYELLARKAISGFDYIIIMILSTI